MTIRQHYIFGLALVLVGTSTALGQHMDQLRARTDAGFDEARLATRTSFEALASYPKDVRDAILSLSTHPDLIIKLNEARTAGTSTVNAIATPHGADMVAAARLAIARPELLQTLVERLPVVTLIGQCAGDQMPTIRAILDQESETRTSATQGLVNAWRKRMTAKPAVTEQLRAAAADFTASQTALQPIGPDSVALPEHPGPSAPGMESGNGLDWTAALTQRVVKPLPADLGNTTSGFGYSAAGSSPVTGLPGHDEAYFALVHSDKYPDLSAAIIEQWYYEPNPDAFRAAVDAWYTTYQDTLPQTLGGQGDMLPGIMKERVLFEKRYITAMRDPAAPRVYRAAFLDANSKDFPALTRVRDNEIIARLNVTPDRVSGGPVSKSTRSGSGGGRSSSGQSTSSTNRGGGRASSGRGGRSSAVGDISSGSRSTRGNGNSGSNRFGNSNSNSRSGGQGNFGSSNSRSGGFGNSSSGSSGSGFGSSGSGFGSGSSGSGGFGNSGSGGFGSSSGSGSSRFGSGNSSSNFDD